MLARLGQLMYFRRRVVLGAGAAFALLAVLLGPAVSSSVVAGGFVDPSTESAQAASALETAFGPSWTDLIVIWRSEDGAADEADLRDVVERLGESPDVVGVIHPWRSDLPESARAPLSGADGVVVSILLAGLDEQDRIEALGRITDSLGAPGWETHVAGRLAVYAEMQQRSEADVARAETLAMPFLLILLVIIFGGLVAAMLPVATGGVAILGTMLLLRGLAGITDVSTFAVNFATIMGLGLAIDYSLFIVSRFREELHSDDDVATAVSRTVATAGRTVAFSGLTVFIAFSGLLFFPQVFLRSMGLGGMAVVLVDVVLALTVVPAALGLLGHRVDSGRLWRRRRPEDHTNGGWARLAGVVVRRPALVAVASSGLIALLTLPALGLFAGETDIRDLPESSPARQASQILVEEFPQLAAPVADVAVVGPVDPTTLAGYTADLAELRDVTDVQVLGAAEGLTHIGVYAAVDDTAAQRSVVRAIRDVPAPGTEVLVGGPAASALDGVSSITEVLPWVLLFVAGVIFVLLFAALGSVVLPLKAVLMNAASLGATIGLVAWGFAQGHLSGLLDFTPTGMLDAAMLVLIGLSAFGLSMDYELFLLSRVREERLRGVDDATAIAVGMQRSGRAITSAALLLVVVLAAMTTSSVTFLKVLGLGLAFAVAFDATVVRALLVPATMRLLGRINWWLPRPLARLHARLDLGEIEDVAAPASVQRLPCLSCQRRTGY